MILIVEVGMSKLTVAQSKTIEEYWSDIPSLKRQLDFREWELTENKKNDENIGGGRSSNISDTTAQKAMVLAEDEKYQHLKKINNAIEFVYQAMATDKKLADLKEFVDMRYISKDSNYYDWEDIAYELGMTRSKVYRLRNKVIDMTAEKLGWL